MEIKLDFENKAIHNYTHNLGVARGLNWALDLVIETMATNGVASNGEEKAYQEALQEAGKLISLALKDLNTKLGLGNINNLGNELPDELPDHLAE
jgi:hypothetical protein